MDLNASMAGVVVLASSFSAFLGAVVMIYRYIVKPIAAAIEEWRSIPVDMAALQTDMKLLAQSLWEHVAQTEERLTAIEPPRPYRRHMTEHSRPTKGPGPSDV